MMNKVRKDVELTFHPHIDEKSVKMTAGRNQVDPRDRTEILYELVHLFMIDFRLTLT